MARLWSVVAFAAVWGSGVGWLRLPTFIYGPTRLLLELLSSVESVSLAHVLPSHSVFPLARVLFIRSDFLRRPLVRKESSSGELLRC